jgi:two-component system NtrC family response regulator
MSITVLIIDDEEKLRKLMVRIIGLEGYSTLEAATLSQAEKLITDKKPDIILCDVKLPDGNGVAFARTAKEKHPEAEIILLTAYGNIADGVQAIKNGAFDYIVKGDDNEKIIPLLSRAAEKIGMQQKIADLEQRLSKKYGFDKIIGNSPLLQHAITNAKKVAETETAVLLNGETGTGKEVFAQSIHSHSKRASGPFVALNCSSFSKELLESELFGHKAGAFTGALKDQKGMIDEAKGGTLFLDEIGEMPPDLQPKLLRFLESGTYYRVGDAKQQTADVRIIAATNRDLLAEAAQGRFRSDLYYRIAVFTITLPSLRERRKDIPALARFFLQTYAAKVTRSIKDIDEAAMNALQQHNWPGNIRELKNVIERAVILEEKETLGLTSLPFELQQGTLASTTNPSSFNLSFMERQHIERVLKLANGNKAEAARLLGIGIATLYRKLEEYNTDPA